MSANQDFFLQLVRIGIGNDNPEKVVIPDSIDWNGLETLAVGQGLSAVLVDGVEKLPEGISPPKPLLLLWIGETLQGYEYRYEQCRSAIAEMAGFYNAHGFKMMVLKGYACSLDWPKPKHRPCGDIDIWLFGNQKEADAALAREKGILIDKEHLHHTVFYWGDFMVENHFEIVNTLVSHSNAKIEKLLEDMAMDDNFFVEVNGQKVWVPSTNFHALFLLRHAVLHFMGKGLNIRQILDWGFFVKSHGSHIDWGWLFGVLEEYGMTPFFCGLNTICTKYLGFSQSIFPECKIPEDVPARIINDIFTPEFAAEEPSSLVKRVAFKYRRRKARTWKHNLCYKEPLDNHLFTSLWLHITHPEMI